MTIVLLGGFLAKKDHNLSKQFLDFFGIDGVFFSPYEKIDSGDFLPSIPSLIFRMEQFFSSLSHPYCIIAHSQASFLINHCIKYRGYCPDFCIYANPSLLIQDFIERRFLAQGTPAPGNHIPVSYTSGRYFLDYDTYISYHHAIADDVSITLDPRNNACIYSLDDTTIHPHTPSLFSSQTERTFFRPPGDHSFRGETDTFFTICHVLWNNHLHNQSKSSPCHS